MRWWLINLERWMRWGAFVFSLLACLALPIASWAQVGSNSGSFDRPFGTEPVLLPLLQAAFQWGIVIIVLAAAIFIAIGAYFYLAASGDAALSRQGKEIITRAIMGLIIGLVGWVLLNTIQPQFAQQLREPEPIPLGGGGGGQ